MAKNTADQEIRERVDAFVSDLTDLVRQAALEAVQEALGGAAAVRAPKPRRGRPPGPAKAKAAKPARKAASGKRVRRSVGDIAEQADAILAAVKSSPGLGFEGLRTELEVDGKDLRRPLNDLLAAGALRKEGEKRGTKYYPGSGKPQRKTAKKTARKKAGRKKAGRKKAARKKATKR